MKQPTISDYSPPYTLLGGAGGASGAALYNHGLNPAPLLESYRGKWGGLLCTPKESRPVPHILSSMITKL